MYHHLADNNVSKNDTDKCDGGGVVDGDGKVSATTVHIVDENMEAVNA